MLNEHAKKWIEALRSGKYKQGLSRLHTVIDGESKFCCLGVACDLYREEVGGGWAVLPYFGRPSTSRVFFVNAETESFGGYLPPSVTKWLGLRYNDGTTYENVTALPRLNDDDKLTFEEIADFIESQPEGLFSAE